MILWIIDRKNGDSAKTQKVEALATHEFQEDVVDVKIRKTHCTTMKTTRMAAMLMS